MPPIQGYNITDDGYPERVRQMADPPKRLYVRGENIASILQRPKVAVVGSRKVTPYGKSATLELVGELARAGVVIVSGLAIGIDGIAHRAALEAGGLTIAVLPTSIEQIYPASHTNLAQQIVQQGGALCSEYAPSDPIYKTNFLARNRIVAALADVLLVTEAAQKSGTLHTARFALEQGKDVMAVPGNINSPTSVGTNNLLKSGASVASCAEDVFHILGVQPEAHKITPQRGNPHEQQIIELLSQGIGDGAALMAASGLQAPVFNQALTMLEISGAIRALGNNTWALH